MRQLIKKILAFKPLRALLAQIKDRYTPAECRAAFVAAMNERSKEWGMERTHWINPSGLGEDDVYSQSTANDLALMAMHVFATGGGKFHGKEVYALNITKPFLIPGYRHKKKSVHSTTSIDTIGNDYPIIGAKTGSGDGYETLVMVCKIGEYVVSGAIMNANDDQGRFDAMDELMRIGEKILYGENKEDSKVTNARNACLYMLDKSGEYKRIFAQNADEQSAPMSTTKVMTLSIVRSYMKDLSKEEYVYPIDLVGAGSDVVEEWDKLTINDLINALMRESSNACSNTLARVTGAVILSK